MKVRINVNGESRELEAEAGTPLLWVLRDSLGLTGTKYGCGVAQCGACTVHIDGRPVRSCVLPVESVGAKQVTTIEAVSGPVADAVRSSWESLQVPQCGYCQSGQVMTAIALLARDRTPDDEAIDGALAGNLCRCATYPRIRSAVHDAAERLAKGGRG